MLRLLLLAAAATAASAVTLGLRAGAASKLEAERRAASELRVEQGADAKVVWSACREVRADEGSWAPTRDLHLIHIPRTMGTSMEQCSTLMPANLNISLWGNKDVAFGRKRQLYSDAYLSTLVGKHVTLVIPDSRVRGTLASVRKGDGNRTLMTLTDPIVEEGGRVKLQNSSEWTVGRGQVKQLLLNNGTAQAGSEGWTSTLQLQRRCMGWHMPPSFLAGDWDYENPYRQEGHNFCVVRDPKQRLISNFQFANLFNLDYIKGKSPNCTVEDMNGYLMDRLKKVQAGDIGIDDCHFVPESLYVYGYDSATGRADKNKRWCDHTFRFETAGTEFSELMNSSGYGVRIDRVRTADDGSVKHTPMSVTDGDCASIGIKHISEEVLALAREVFREDHENFKY